jgi:hypothetical protein
MSLEHGKHHLDTMLLDESDRFPLGGRQLGHGAGRAANATTDADIARSFVSAASKSGNSIKRKTRGADVTQRKLRPSRPLTQCLSPLKKTLIVKMT